MTIGSISESMSGGEENADFALLRRLRDETEKELSRDLELSMGMSADYKLGTSWRDAGWEDGHSSFYPFWTWREQIIFFGRLNSLKIQKYFELQSLV